MNFIMDFIIPRGPNINYPAAIGLLVIVLSLTAIVCFRLFYVDIPQVKNIPEIPSGDLLAGHLYQLGIDHATTAEEWATKFGWPVYQLRMGRRRAVVLNSFDAARDWMVKNQSATLDRPWFYTFHGVVSKTSAATIGTSQWDERTKKQRRVVGSLTTGPSIQKLREMLDLETFSMVSGLHTDSDGGKNEIIPHIYQKRLALNVMMMFCYGTRFASVTDPLFLQILSDASTIASFRSTNSNAQDFIPHLRYIGDKQRTVTALEVRTRRDKWLAAMLNKVRENLPLRTGSKKSVAELLLTDSNEGLTKRIKTLPLLHGFFLADKYIVDVKTILGGLMSGGFETLFSTAIITIGMLASSEGQSMQQKAYEDIMGVYESPEEAFDLCATKEKSPYIVALVKEALRFYPPLKLLPARQVYKDFIWQGAKIPKGVLFYVNAQAANRDKNMYGPDADCFLPDRSIKTENPIPPPYHFAFGAGARMCTAVNFSNRVLYAMFVRMIILFRMTESKTMPANTHYVDYKRDSTASNAIASDFKVKFTVRDEGVLGRCFARSEEQCKSVLTRTEINV